MLYLGRGRLAICYQLSLAVVLTALIMGIHHGAIGVGFQSGMMISLALVYGIGFVHSLLVARRVQGEKSPVWFARWYWVFLLAILLPTAISSSIRWFLWEPFDLPSGSMKPALQVGDMVYVSKYTYGFSPYSTPFNLGIVPLPPFGDEPARGDIAVFKHPSDTGTDYIKRIIGLPGDRIQMVDGVLQINGQAVTRRAVESAPEDIGYYGEKLQRYIEILPGGISYPILEESDNGIDDNTRLFEVPENHYFALGDNRDNSRDSRIFGSIPKENLVGRLSLIFWNEEDRRLKFLD